jgi:hypothetical protein
MTLGGQWRRCLEAAHMMCHYYDLSKHRSTPSRTPPRSYAASPPSTSSKIRRSSFTQPQAAAGKCRPTSSSKMPRRAARRGASSAARRLQPQLTMIAASTSKQAAPSWCALWLSQAMASIRRDCPRTTSRSSMRIFAQNHAYPIKHKLRDYGMMNNFMVSGSEKPSG